MANPYFNLYQTAPESSLIADLYTEAIYNMGFSGNYLPNTNGQAKDLIYGDDPLKVFSVAYTLDMYLVNTFDYGDEADFFSKFGLEVRNQIKVQIAAKSFEQSVDIFSKPREGDLIFIPFFKDTGELFEIKFAEQSKDFHMLGRPQPYFYELNLEKFKYSQEVIATGMEDIDLSVTNNAYTLSLNINHVTGTGYYEIKEIVYQAPDNTHANATTVAIVQSFIPSSNTLTVTNIAGEFIDGQEIIGVSSNARYTLVNFDPLLDNSFSETYDNKHIDLSSEGVVNFSEANPFGNI